MRARRSFGLLSAAVVGAAALMMGPFSTAAARDPVSVWVVGDSVSMGYTGPSGPTAGKKGLTELQLSTPGGYRGFMDAGLTDLGVAHRFVGTLTTNPPPVVNNESERHDGHVGFWVELLDMGLDGPDDFPDIGGGEGGGHWLTGTPNRPGLNPDVIVIQAGIADVVVGRDPVGVYPRFTYNRKDARQREVFVTHLMERYRSLLADVHRLRPHARIVLSTLTPIAFRSKATKAVEPDPTAITVNRLMRDALVPEFADRGVKIVLADIDTPLRENRALMADDLVHPTARGYAVVGTVMADAVKRVLAK